MSSARADKGERVDIPDAAPEDAKAARDVGLVLHDGNGHYLAFTLSDPTAGDTDTHRLFYGDGKTFYRVKSDRNVSGVGLVEWPIADARRGLDGWRSQLMFDHGTFTMRCRTEDGPTPLIAVPTADARKLLAKAVFKERRMDRRAFALGRDGSTYYYVDLAVRPANNTDFRLYLGKRGAAKRIKLKHSATDAEGTVLVAKEGSLRITADPLALQWSPKPSKKVALAVVTIEDNPELIFEELGVYTGKPFGVPCDDM